MAQRDRRREKRGGVLYDEKRAGDEAGSGGDVGTNNKAVYKDLIDMGDTCQALSDGDRVDTLLGLPDDCRDCLRGDMVHEAALGNVDGCMIDGGS